MRQRRSVRLREHTYADGTYFVTVCCHGRQRLFGEVASGEMVRSELGDLAHDEWERTCQRYEHLHADLFVVMPDHVHMLLALLPSRLPPLAPETRRTPLPGTLGAVIGQYKSAVSRHAQRLYLTTRVWQRGYYDRVVRSDREAENIRRYIAENPMRWDALDPGRRDGHRL
ncbi:transposase [Rubricoccus marinus]|uniref:Transposase IS200-like domain-containing protein n=1 Tax=Rubricoccus marinus TaxID=716817 RepID=A0A259U3A4_9BACT|nr:transposase [Rubricoccus marinus]OZC04432.1 hypothetical protein BSZ36_16450 [Rubricoccus marinus]